LNIVSRINITNNIKEQVEESVVVEGTYLHELANKLFVPRSDNTNNVYLSAIKLWEKIITVQSFPDLPGNHSIFHVTRFSTG
jgi:hypothetical protein